LETEGKTHREKERNVQSRDDIAWKYMRIDEK
jgi:hypothetical protein